jgi:hypothetical protein
VDRIPQSKAGLVVARGIPGVKAVRDHRPDLPVNGRLVVDGTAAG